MKLLNFILRSNFILAVAAVLLTVSTQIQLGIKPFWNSYVLLIFFATLFEYNHHRLNKIRLRKIAENPAKYRWHTENKSWIYFLLFISIVGFIITAFTTDLKFLMALLPFGFLTFLYSLPVSKKNKSHFLLRRIPFFKIFILSFVWSASTIILPVIQNNTDAINKDVFMLFAERFLFVFAIAIPFDIRDMNEDQSSGLKTIPVIFNQHKALVLSYVALSLSFVISLFHYAQNNRSILLPLFFTISSTIFILSSKSLKKSDENYYQLLDGTLILLGGLVLVFYFLF